MKKNIIHILSAFLILSFISSCGKGKPTPQSGGRVKYAQGIDSLKFGDQKFQVYTRAKVEPVNQETAKRKLTETLESIGLSNIRFRLDTAKIEKPEYIRFRLMEDPSAVFEISLKTGRILLNTGLKKYKGDNETEGLPDEKTAVDLAKRLIEKMRLSPNQAELSEPETSGLEMSYSRDNESKTFKKLVTVRFDRKLDGLKVMGPSRLLFTFGQKAEPTSVIIDWAKLEAAEASKDRVLPPSEVIKQIETRLEKLAGDSAAITVTSRGIVMYDDGQSLFEPAVFVKATIKEKGGQEYPVDLLEPILKDSRAAFPQVKDQALRTKPGEMKKNSEADTLRGKDDE